MVGKQLVIACAKLFSRIGIELFLQPDLLGPSTHRRRSRRAACHYLNGRFEISAWAESQNLFVLSWV
jgi:hypothetical protein